MKAILPGAITDGLQLLLFLLALVYFGIAFFSLLPKKEILKHEITPRFAILIPAHNEASVLGQTLKSLHSQTYPQHLYQVFVLADACTDQTAMIAEKMGAKVLYRTTTKKGKGVALADGLTQLLAHNPAFDLFAIIDADNTVDSRFLTELSLSFQQGHQIIQGYIDAKSSQPSLLSYGYAFWYWISNRLLQQGFSKLGFGCRLGGTGFAISRSILEQIPWKTNSLAEDGEYTALLSLRQKKIFYAPKAVVYDEKPTDFSVSIRQRTRWAQGICAMQRDYSLPLLKRGRWGTLLLLYGDFLMPLCFFLFLILDFFAITNLCQLTHVSFVDLWMRPIPLLFLNFYVWGTVLLTGVGLFLDRKISWNLIPCIVGFFLYLISWIPIGITGIFTHTKTEWYHTKHNG